MPNPHGMPENLKGHKWNEDPSTQARGTVAAAKARRERLSNMDEMARWAVEEPARYIRKLFELQAMIVYELQAKAIKTGRIDDRRFFMEAVRECRNLAGELRAILEAEGEMARTDRELEDLETRIEAAQERLAAPLGPSPVALSP